MNVETYDKRYLAGMCAAWNAMTEAEPHIAPLTPERFVAFVEDKSYYDPAGLFVALDGGRVAGWAHACVAPCTEPYQDANETFGRIRMLAFARHRMDVGCALVDEATRWLRGRSDGEILAMHCRGGYPFYRGLWMGGEPLLPATLSHVMAALAGRGYALTHESIFMTAALCERPQACRARINLDFEDTADVMKSAAMRESWRGFEPRLITGRSEGEDAGRAGYVLLPHLDRLGHPCVNIWVLGTAADYRREGVATALLSRALAAGWEAGARVASVGTQLWNRPAHAAYARFGFRPDRLMVGLTLSSEA